LYIELTPSQCLDVATALWRDFASRDFNGSPEELDQLSDDILLIAALIKCAQEEES
jgi:hypothetical protein